VLKKMRALRPAGEVKDYTSVNTEVLGWLVEAVSGERYAKFIEREIWQRLGAEHDALVLSTPTGNSFSAGGVCSTLRDLARFGMLFTPTGRSGGDPVVSRACLQKIQKGGRPNLIKGVDWYLRLSTLATGASVIHSTYQWDAVTSSGDFFKGGYGGQGLYVSPGKDLVVAWFGSPTKDGQLTGMFSVALQLANGELFPR
jgi:CubicO group peptidase (beta-lactamase class C family)